MATNYPVNGSVWFRESTNEWVLELSGTINETNFTARHTQPAHVAPEDVPGLDTLYDDITNAQTDALNATEHALNYESKLPYEKEYWADPVQVANGVFWFGLGAALCWLMV